MSQGIHLVSNGIPGYTHDGKCPASGRTPLLSYSSNKGYKLFGGANFIKTLPIYTPRNSFIICKAANNHRRNPDFSRQKGNSRGKNRHYQERDHSDSLDETDPLPSKNGSLLSLSSNQRYSATATPGRREKEIVELFRKVQAQLRERAAIKEEKKIEASQQGQGERGTVDSLLKLLRKHSVAQGKRSNKEEQEEFNLDQPEGSDTVVEEPNSNFFSSSSITTSKEVIEEDLVPFSRPRSSFRRRSPVPRVKFQPVFSTEVKVDVEKKDSDDELEPELVEDSLDEISDSSDIDESKEDNFKPAAVEIADLSSMKLTELRGLAKSRGIKGYSKLKKSDLIELLSRADS